MPAYLDHAATTPLDPAVLDAMLPFMREHYGNASSVHGPGRRARVAVERARERVAGVLGCSPAEVVFTSGGTEADNLALHGTLSAPEMASRPGLVTSAAEHEAVLRPSEALAERGHPVAFLPPGPGGAVTPTQVTEAADAQTGLVSLMYANNETGALTDVPGAARAAREAGALVHTDAVQAPGLLPLGVDGLGVDLLSLSAHKMGGPKGVGALFVRAGTPLAPMLSGGAQERRRRGGTENVPGIVGMAEALVRAEAAREATALRLSALRDALAARVREAFGPAVRFNTPLGGGPEGWGGGSEASDRGATEASQGLAAPHVLSLSFHPGPAGPLDGEMLLLGLDMAGVYASAGSACTSGALEPSHVLLALGVPRATAGATVRFSLGRETTAADIALAAEALITVVRRLGGVVA